MPLLYAPIFLFGGIGEVHDGRARAAPRPRPRVRRRRSAGRSARPTRGRSSARRTRPARDRSRCGSTAPGSPDGLAEDRERALARPELTGDELHERRLAGAVRTEQAGDAGRHRDVTSFSPITWPYHFDTWSATTMRRSHATTSMPRTRRSRTTIDAPISSAIIRNAHQHRHVESWFEPEHRVADLLQVGWRPTARPASSRG